MISHQRANTDWFHRAQWGVMLHYLAGQPGWENSAVTAEAWNQQVDAFDVQATVATLQDVRAGYLIFTIGQNSGFFCSPNATYDRIVGVQPSRLSRRDLIGELAEACAQAGIPLIAYLPTHAPALHREAVQALGFTPAWDASAWGLAPGTYLRESPVDQRLTMAQRNWEAVIREWSLRWGENVKGWWLDGCYFSDKMYRHDDEPNFGSFAAALKSGNSHSIISFNSGVHSVVRPTSEFDDYTAGEINHLHVPTKNRPFDRFIDGAQFHHLSFLGNFWRFGNPRFPDALAVEYTKYINSLDGVMSWDVPIDEAGKIPEAFVAQLRLIGEASRKRS